MYGLIALAAILFWAKEMKGKWKRSLNFPFPTPLCNMPDESKMTAPYSESTAGYYTVKFTLSPY